MGRYAVFISYSHAADGRLAPALQRGLQRLAKPFYRRRALNVFRDKTGLGVDESLWGAIVSALDQSGYFLLLASPASAASPWVGRELSRWIENNPDRRPLIALTDGVIAWDEGAGDFDWSSTDAVPRALSGVYPDEPLWIDLRWARTETHLSLRHPQFRDAVADLAATVHGVSKDQIAGQDLREHRRTLAVAWSAVAGLVVLTAVAVTAAVVAHRNEQRALSRLLAAQSINALEEKRLDRALLLAVEAADHAQTHEALDALMSSVQRQPALRTLLHGAGKVRRLVFSPDGRSLASVSSDGLVRVWDVAGGSMRVPPFRAGEGVPKGLYFSGDGNTLLVVHPRWRTTWDLGDGRATEVSLAELPPGMAATAEASPGAAASSLTEKPAGAPLKSAVSPDGKYRAVASGDSVEVWHVAGDEPLGAPLSAQGPVVRALAFSPRQPLLASGSTDGTVALWDLSLPPLGREISAHRTSANRVAFSPDGMQLASTGYSGDIALWDAATGDSLAQAIPRPGGNVQALQFSSSGDELLVQGRSVTRWRMPDLKPVGPGISTLPRGAASAISPDLSSVATGGNDGEVQVWDLERGRLLWGSKSGHGDRLFALAFSPDGTTLASAGNDRVVALWDAASGDLLGAPLQGHGRAVSALAFTGDGARLASYDSHGALIVWDVAARRMLGQPLQREDGYAGTSAMAITADARLAAVSGAGGFVRLWDTATWRPVGEPLPGHPGDVVDLAFSPDGARLASAGLGGTVILWDLRPSAWMDRACKMANRSLSAEEVLIFLSVADAEERPAACRTPGR